jgi:hypothetical protein
VPHPSTQCLHLLPEGLQLQQELVAVHGWGLGAEAAVVSVEAGLGPGEIYVLAADVMPPNKGTTDRVTLLTCGGTIAVAGSWR